MPHVIRSSEAVADLIEIWAYIAEDNPSAADGVAERFDRLFEKLASQPEIGKGVAELATDLRSFATGSYPIFYRPIGFNIEIARILHGARDITADFFRT